MLVKRESKPGDVCGRGAGGDGVGEGGEGEGERGPQTECHKSWEKHHGLFQPPVIVPVSRGLQSTVQYLQE